MTYGEVTMYPCNAPIRTNRYITGQTASSLYPELNAGHIDHTPNIISGTNRLESFDDDPLTSQELADLDISNRELKEGKFTVLSKELSDEEFFTNL